MKFFFNVLLLMIFSNVSSKAVEYRGDCKFHGDMNKFIQCLEDELNVLDKELNQTYKKIYKDDNFKYLKNAELHWIKYKEEDCNYFAVEVDGGQQYPLIHLACLINKTKVRIKELNRATYYRGWFEKSC